MARRLITFGIRILARVFFRRIEIAGAVPPGVPIIFAVNHPNALIDPLFLLCFAPRPVSFLAKAPLFRTFFIGWFVRAFDSIPVYRKQDNVSTSSNRETFAKARSILASGGAVALFPEGTTHSDPKLRELKSGAARIALGASIRVFVIPTGLYYTSKQTFRSSALMLFGDPIAVDPQPVDEAGEPPAAAVEALTERIEAALAEVTLQAESHDALDLIARAERIFSAGTRLTLAQELELRKRFVEGYAYFCEHDPERVQRLAAAITQIDPPPRTGRVRARFLFLLPLGFIGAIIHWPVYRLIDLIAKRQDTEMAATVKFIGGMVLYPLWWIAIAFYTRPYALLILPILGYCAILASETMQMIRTRHPDVSAIREEIMRLSERRASDDRASATGPSPQG